MAQAVVAEVPEVEVLAVRVEVSTTLADPRERIASVGPCFLPPVRDPPRADPRPTTTKMSRPVLARIPRSIRRLRRHRVPVRPVRGHKM